MAFLRVCDRCDHRTSPDEYGRGNERPIGWTGLVMSVREATSNPHRPETTKHHYELCASCTKELRGWFK